jgi:hypothetical protein
MSHHKRAGTKDPGLVGSKGVELKDVVDLAFHGFSNGGTICLSTPKTRESLDLAEQGSCRDTVYVSLRISIKWRISHGADAAQHTAA